MTESSREKGFTLIEILIVISVIAIISVTGIAALSTFQTNQLMNATAKDLVSTLNLAKSRARTQVKPSFCTNPDPEYTLAGYEVRLCKGFSGCINPDAGDYEINVICKTSLGVDSPSNISSKKIPTAYTFGSSSSNVLFFPVLDGGVETGGDIFINIGSTLIKTVSVDESGNIDIQ